MATMVDPLRKLWLPENDHLLLARLTKPLWFGHLAVAAFIVLSGYSLQLALFKRSENGDFAGFSKYIVRRARRILPPYYACLAISILVCLLVTQKQTSLPFTQYVPLTTGNVMSHLLLVHNFNPAWMYKINGVLWSIAIEAQLYVVFPILVALRARLGVLVQLVVAAGVVWAGFQLVPAAPKLYFWYFWLFALGGCAAWWAKARGLGSGRPQGTGDACRPGAEPRWNRGEGEAVGRGDKKLNLFPFIVGLLAAILLVLGCTTAQQAKSVVLPDLLFGTGTALLLLVLTACPTWKLNRVLGWRPLVALGGFSYSLYLMHHPILQALFVHRPSGIQTELKQFAYLLACTPIIVGLCYLFHLAFERPFMTAPQPISSEKSTA